MVIDFYFQQLNKDWKTYSIPKNIFLLTHVVSSCKYNTVKRFFFIKRFSGSLFFNFSRLAALKDSAGSNVCGWRVCTTIIILFVNFSRVWFSWMFRKIRKSEKNKPLRKKGVLQQYKKIVNGQKKHTTLGPMIGPILWKNNVHRLSFSLDIWIYYIICSTWTYAT